MTDERMQKTGDGARVEMIGNLCLAVMKGVMGYFSGSKGLIADALHSVANMVGAFVMQSGGKTQKRPADDPSFHGKGRIQIVTAIIISVILLVIACEMGISALKTLIAGAESPPKTMALVAIAISIVVKEMMHQYKFRNGKKQPHPVLIAYGWERRSDLYASVAVLVGVLGAIIGQYSGYVYLYNLDPLAGLFIAVLILSRGCRLVMEVIHNQAEHRLHDEDAKALIQTVQTIKGVITVDELQAREHGHYVVVDVKISVNPRISVQEGHEIARLAKQALMKRFHHVSDVFIHVNPYDPGYPYKNNVDSDTDTYPTLLH